MEGEKQVKLKALEEDIKHFGGTLQEAAQTIINQNISNYPIFVAYEIHIGLGIELIEKSSEQSNWSFNATTLEELATKSIIVKDKLDGFRMLYKSKPPADFVCVFIVDEELAEFVFYPYKEVYLGNQKSDN